MSLPAGATHVRYFFEMFPGEFNFTFETAFENSSATENDGADTALEAGANAVIASLQSQFPGLTVNATRIYIGTITGDPWP